MWRAYPEGVVARVRVVTLTNFAWVHVTAGLSDPLCNTVSALCNIRTRVEAQSCKGAF